MNKEIIDPKQSIFSKEAISRYLNLLFQIILVICYTLMFIFAIEAIWWAFHYQIPILRDFISAFAFFAAFFFTFFPWIGAIIVAIFIIHWIFSLKHLFQQIQKKEIRIITLILPTFSILFFILFPILIHPEIKTLDNTRLIQVTHNLTPTVNPLKRIMRFVIITSENGCPYRSLGWSADSNHLFFDNNSRRCHGPTLVYSITQNKSRPATESDGIMFGKKEDWFYPIEQYPEETREKLNDIYHQFKNIDDLYIVHALPSPDNKWIVFTVSYRSIFNLQDIFLWKLDSEEKPGAVE